MVRLAVVGATGRLGRRVVAAALASDAVTLEAAIGRTPGEDVGVLAGLAPVGLAVRTAEAGLGAADVVIDVSLPEGLARTLSQLDGRPLVTGVTGLSSALREALDAAALQGPVLVAANFSAGVAVLADLVARAARALPDFDVEITETHHVGKVDAPSGTAIRLGEAVAGARGQQLDEVVRHGRQGHTGVRPPGEIGMHALRCGDVVGEHEVWLAGHGERLRLGHVATSRDTFAVGALRAAVWLATQPPGMYTMRDVLGLDAQDVQAPRQG